MGNVGAIADGSYAYAGAVVGVGKADDLQNCYWADEMEFITVDTSKESVADAVPGETPTNAIGTEKAEAEFGNYIFVNGALMWSTSAWSVGTADEPALPTLVNVGPTFTVVDAE